MRLIKYRLWNKSERVMRPVEDLSFGVDGDAKTIIAYWSEDGHRGYIVDGESGHVMQFTGTYDKHGREIYEGDICRMKYGTREIVAPMIYDVKRMQFGLDATLPESYKGPDHIESTFPPEIIGHIYEDSNYKK